LETSHQIPIRDPLGGVDLREGKVAQEFLGGILGREGRAVNLDQM
jgi:hypothetical protein